MGSPSPHFADSLPPFEPGYAYRLTSPARVEELVALGWERTPNEHRNLVLLRRRVVRGSNA